MDKVVLIPNYTTPHIKSKDDSGSRMVERKAIEDICRELPIYPDPVYRPPSKPVKTPIPQIPRSLSDIDPQCNTDFEENMPFQEGMISETDQRTDQSYFQEPQELESLINRGMLLKKVLLKQADIDKILMIIQRKVPKGIHLPVTVKEIQTGYLVNQYFKDLYLYLGQNKLPSTKTAICKVETLAKIYILLDLLLFKLVITPEKERTLLAIPEMCTDKIIMLYHSSLIAGHQGVI